MKEVVTSTILFFFKCLCDHRDLHSFPTRRSSDLQRQPAARRADRLLSPGSLPGTGSRHALDRKSTRLNSSHPSISYAVFCLKKKKKNHQHHTTNNHKIYKDRNA